ncbi:MAG: 50S ribosomal protein L7/L12 [Candidatus Krumholzibacteriales bacterium]
MKKIVDMVKELSVMELSELVGVLEDLFGVSASAPMAMAPGAMPAAAAEEEEEQTEFDVVLKEIGSQKIQVIKVVRSVTDLGLIDAKKLVEGAPETVKEGLSKEEAEEVKGKLEEVGATIELK